MAVRRRRGTPSGGSTGAPGGRADPAARPTPRSGLVVAGGGTDQLLGQVSWYRECELTDWRRLGPLLFDETSWVRGCGTTALRLWTDYLFAATDALRLDYATYSGNPGTIRVGQRLGLPGGAPPVAGPAVGGLGARRGDHGCAPGGVDRAVGRCRGRWLSGRREDGSPRGSALSRRRRPTSRPWWRADRVVVDFSRRARWSRSRSWCSAAGPAAGPAWSTHPRPGGRDGGCPPSSRPRRGAHVDPWPRSRGTVEYRRRGTGSRCRAECAPGLG
ncbi:GNAT family N-acetyltransferase, partial [Actinoalloteichus caeruleus]